MRLVSRVNKPNPVSIPKMRIQELLHIDLFGTTKTLGLGGNRYEFVIVDDSSGFTWVLFHSHKDDSFEAFRKFYKKVQNKKDLKLFL